MYTNNEIRFNEFVQIVKGKSSRIRKSVKKEDSSHPYLKY